MTEVEIFRNKSVMETINEENFELENLLTKCRCCFRTLTLINEKKYIEINKSIEQKFYELTNIKVRHRRFLKNYFKHQNSLISSEKF